MRCGCASPWDGHIENLSLIDESGARYVRIGQPRPVWAATPSTGVAALHTELVETTILKDFYDLFSREVQ